MNYKIPGRFLVNLFLRQLLLLGKDHLKLVNYITFIQALRGNIYIGLNTKNNEYAITSENLKRIQLLVYYGESEQYTGELAAISFEWILKQATFYAVAHGSNMYYNTTTAQIPIIKALKFPCFIVKSMGN